MPVTSSTSSGTITLPEAIERYFQVSLYLLVLTGFGTLASTGTLDAPAVLLVGMALLVRGYFLGRRVDATISTRWTNYLTIGYVACYVVDYTLLSENFLPATVHLVLFGMVVRLFSAQKDRDHYMLAVLSFLMVLAAAVLTVDSVFLIAFAGFMLMAVATFVLMEMRRSSQTATIPAREPVDPMTYRRMAFFLGGASPALVVLILAGASAIFFVLPRMSVGYLSSYAAGNDMATGFSDQVQLGRIGQIQQSSAVVMHVQIDGDKHGAYDLKWRGISLHVFDGKSWSNPTEQSPLFRQHDGRFALEQKFDGSQLSLGQAIHYRVLMEPIGTNIFFLADRARFLSGVYRMVSTDRAGSIYDLDAAHPISLYEADSELAVSRPDKLRRAPTTYLPEIELKYLQRPPHLDARIAEMARQVTGSADNNYDRALLLERYLMTNYAYTLQLPRIAPQDPLADFLFVRKRGHCEYFASSMAIMLRTLGIPSRVVNGFRTTEFNDLTSNYVIRASSAHSWVEAYFPGSGWISFDPTPGAARMPATGWSRMLLYVDAMASFWREWVINYDVNHQRALGEGAMQGSRLLVERARLWVQSRYAELLDKARHAQQSVAESPKRWTALAIGLALLLVLTTNARLLLRWIREQRLRRHPEEAPQRAAALWYKKMVRLLARKGWKKTPTQTPQEFLTKIEDSALRERVEQFTRAYEAARFGESPEEAVRLPELYEEISPAVRR
jgi:transglutaminase-like putative cysteine protease